MLKEIIVIIRPGKWPATAVKLAEVGALAYTRHRVHGRGKQKGLRYGATAPGEEPSGISFLPKWMVHIVLEDSQVDAVVKALIEANRTGEIGDGRIFICPVVDAVRVRTSETEQHAVN